MPLAQIWNLGTTRACRDSLFLGDEQSVIFDEEILSLCLPQSQIPLFAEDGISISTLSLTFLLFKWLKK